MHFCTVFARCSRAWNTYQWRYGNRLSYARNIQSREFPGNGRTGEVPEMCISFTSRQCMSVGIIEQREMDVITLVLHLIVFILAPKVCVTKITDANIRCKTFEENGEKTLGFVTRLPHGKTPCYELDGYFNCNGLAGEDRDYCVKTCCKDAKRYTGLKIKCIVFTNGSSEKSEGFYRKTPPYINVKCYENGGIFNCEALKEPEISHCKSTCCRGSYNGTMKDVNEVWEFKSVEIEDRKDSGE